jgi:hypothetical protein
MQKNITILFLSVVFLIVPLQAGQPESECKEPEKVTLYFDYQPRAGMSKGPVRLIVPITLTGEELTEDIARLIGKSPNAIKITPSITNGVQDIRFVDKRNSHVIKYIPLAVTDK